LFFEGRKPKIVVSVDGAQPEVFSKEFMGTIKSVHKDCLEPQLILAHPTGWFKFQDEVKLNNKNIFNASEFTGKNIFNLCKFS
jgi:hypothetical protein